MRRFLDADDDDDPILSVVNVIDVFLVIVVMLLIQVARSGATDVPQGDEAGEVVPELTESLERYDTSGEIGEGTGVRAGTTYRLDDGTMVFVADEGDDRPANRRAE